MPSHPSIQMGSPPLVKAAATVLKELCYHNREDLQAGFITAGWDKKKGPQVCYWFTVYTQMMTGTLKSVTDDSNSYGSDASCGSYRLMSLLESVNDF